MRRPYTRNETRTCALNNRMEYFAETTEACSGTNGLYPLTRAELIRCDQGGAEALKQIGSE